MATTIETGAPVDVRALQVGDRVIVGVGAARHAGKVDTIDPHGESGVRIGLDGPGRVCEVFAYSDGSLNVGHKGRVLASPCSGLWRAHEPAPPVDPPAPGPDDPAAPEAHGDPRRARPGDVLDLDLPDVGAVESFAIERVQHFGSDPTRLTLDVRGAATHTGLRNGSLAVIRGRVSRVDLALHGDAWRATLYASLVQVQGQINAVRRTLLGVRPPGARAPIAVPFPPAPRTLGPVPGRRFVPHGPLDLDRLVQPGAVVAVRSTDSQRDAPAWTVTRRETMHGSGAVHVTIEGRDGWATLATFDGWRTIRLGVGVRFRDVHVQVVVDVDGTAVDAPLPVAPVVDVDALGLVEALCAMIEALRVEIVGERAVKANARKLCALARRRAKTADRAAVVDAAAAWGAAALGDLGSCRVCGAPCDAEADTCPAHDDAGASDALEGRR